MTAILLPPFLIPAPASRTTAFANAFLVKTAMPPNPKKDRKRSDYFESIKRRVHFTHVKTGECVLAVGIAAFARERNLLDSLLFSVISGRGKTHLGWRLSTPEEIALLNGPG